MASLKDDTVADKLVRFVLGAVGGAGSGWVYAGSSGDDRTALGTIAVLALVGGLMAMLLGNRFIEWALRRGR